MLGPQFDHTHWHDENGELVQMSKGTTGIRNEYGTVHQGRMPPVKADEDLNPLTWMNESRAAKGIQGSLFSPYVGTGLKEDPTVRPGAREEAASQALRVIQVGTSAASLTPDVTKHHVAAVRNALVQSDMPIQEMNKGAIRATQVGAGLERAKGDYHPHEQVIRVNSSNDTSTLVHEMGHAADPNVTSPWNQRTKLREQSDPLEEGVADARMDRYATNAHHPDASPDAARDLAHRQTVSGYTDASWDAPLHQAMYNSARTIASRSDNAIRQLPGREALWDQRVERGSEFDRREKGGKVLFAGHPDLPMDTGSQVSTGRILHSMNKLAMGHMMEHHGDVIRPSLNEVQLSAAMDAHAYYKKTEPRSFLSHPGEEYHQGKLL